MPKEARAERYIREMGRGLRSFFSRTLIIANASNKRRKQLPKLRKGNKSWNLYLDYFPIK